MGIQPTINRVFIHVKKQVCAKKALTHTHFLTCFQNNFRITVTVLIEIQFITVPIILIFQ